MPLKISSSVGELAKSTPGDRIQPSSHHSNQITMGGLPDDLGLPVVSGPTIGDVPDSFFSEGDFVTTPPKPSILVQRAPTLPLARPPYVSPEISPLCPIKMIPDLDTTHDMQPVMPISMTHKLSSVNSTAPMKQECIVPQASRADLLAEKGRISMEICDLMDAMDNDGAVDAELRKKLDSFKQRRYNAILALIACFNSLCRKEIDAQLSASVAGHSSAPSAFNITPSPLIIADKKASPMPSRLELESSPSEWASYDFPWSRNIRKALKQ